MKEQYSAGDIQLLEPVDAIRKRPGMYVGDCGDGSVLAWLLIEEVVRVHAAREATELHVAVTGSWVTVRDDGPGIPVDELDYHGRRISALELIATVFRPGGARRPTLDLAIVNALSARLEVETTRAGIRWTQAFERGRRVTPLRNCGPTTLAGTTIRFQPDPTIFANPVDADALRDRLGSLAWLAPLLRITFQERRLPGLGGPAAWVRELARDVGPITASYATVHHEGATRIDLALAWCDAPRTVLRTFANLSPLRRGTPLAGLWQGLATWSSMIGASPDLAHVRRRLAPGLVGVVHVTLADPQFRTACHDDLSSPEAAAAVCRALQRETEDRWSLSYLRDHLRARLGA